MYCVLRQVEANWFHPSLAATPPPFKTETVRHTRDCRPRAGYEGSGTAPTLEASRVVEMNEATFLPRHPESTVKLPASIGLTEGVQLPRKRGNSVLTLATLKRPCALSSPRKKVLSQMLCSANFTGKSLSWSLHLTLRGATNSGSNEWVPRAGSYEREASTVRAKPTKPPTKLQPVLRKFRSTRGFP